MLYIKFLIFNLLIVVACPAVFAQDQKIADSLLIIYQQNQLTDTAKLSLLKKLAFHELNLEKALKYSDELIAEASKAKDDKYLAAGFFISGSKKRQLGNFEGALDAFFKSAAIAKKTNQVKSAAECYTVIADAYSGSGNHPKAVYYYREALNTLPLPKNHNDSISYASVFLNVGDEYLSIKQYDSSLGYSNKAKNIFDETKYQPGIGYSLGNIGMIYANTSRTVAAEKNLKQAIDLLNKNENYEPVCTYLLTLADLYSAKGDSRLALDYANQSVQLSEQNGYQAQIVSAHLKLSELYEKSGDYPAALSHYKTHLVKRDILYNREKDRIISELDTRFQVSQKQREVDLEKQKRQNSKNLTLALIIILALALFILGGLFRNIRNRKKAYKLLTTQKKETERERAKAEEALTELQVTQNQLIHSAKMASLGELTAGIAHEIQNPLNFVNNFSELNVDLLQELREGVISRLDPKGKTEAEAILNDLSDNLKKIGDHGKRADSIVKGMLQHSRVSDNKKVLTDINALADEYLRLSYHGLRSKDAKSTIAIETTFDDKIEEFLIVPQDIGRVLINLYSNAFYALNEKAKQNVKDYEPKILVTTKAIMKEGKFRGAQIHIKDNGIGIPDKLLDKIYQPFFTTKPPGQGTGLGLSLSYDIITNGHKGSLKVATEENEYTEFIIELPAKENGVQHLP